MQNDIIEKHNDFVDLYMFRLQKESSTKSLWPMAIGFIQDIGYAFWILDTESLSTGNVMSFYISLLTRWINTVLGLISSGKCLTSGKKFTQKGMVIIRGRPLNIILERSTNTRRDKE